MWWWLYIVSLSTKLCWKKKTSLGSMQGRYEVEVFVDGKIYSLNEKAEEEEGK